MTPQIELRRYSVTESRWNLGSNERSRRPSCPSHQKKMKMTDKPLSYPSY